MIIWIVGILFAAEIAHYLRKSMERRISMGEVLKRGMTTLIFAIAFLSSDGIPENTVLRIIYYCIFCVLFYNWNKFDKACDKLDKKD